MAPAQYPVAQVGRRSQVLPLCLATLVIWRTRNGVGRINEVTLRRARLVLGWATVLGGHITSVYNQPPGQLSLLPSAGREKCGDALQLERKAKMANSIHE